jgi:hypothetical protein
MDHLLADYANRLKSFNTIAESRDPMSESDNAEFLQAMIAMQGANWTVTNALSMKHGSIKGILNEIK